MPSATVIELEANDAGLLTRSHGVLLNGAFYTNNRARERSGQDLAAVRLGNILHDSYRSKKPFTISPLLGLRYDESGVADFHPGQKCYFRVTCLDDLAESKLNNWLKDLEENNTIYLSTQYPQQIPGSAENRTDFLLKISPSSWQVKHVWQNGTDHLLAGKMDYASFRSAVEEEGPATGWKVHLMTPTTFHAGHGNQTFPFPTPELLIRSWNRAWQEFCNIPLSTRCEEIARSSLQIVDYQIDAVKLNFYRSTYLFSKGQVTLKQCASIPRAERIDLAVLFKFAFFCGTGFRTTQGLGLTRVEEFRK